MFNTQTDIGLLTWSVHFVRWSHNTWLTRRPDWTVMSPTRQLGWQWWCQLFHLLSLYCQLDTFTDYILNKRISIFYEMRWGVIKIFKFPLILVPVSSQATTLLCLLCVLLFVYVLAKCFSVHVFLMYANLMSYISFCSLFFHSCHMIHSFTCVHLICCF